MKKKGGERGKEGHKFGLGRSEVRLVARCIKLFSSGTNLLSQGRAAEEGGRQWVLHATAGLEEEEMEGWTYDLSQQLEDC